MLRTIRKNMKWIMIAVAVMFIISILYGLRYGVGTGGGETQKREQKFIKINGEEINPGIYLKFLENLRMSLPSIISPQEMLYLQSMALSQTIEFTLIMDQAEKQVKVTGAELNKTLEQLAKSQKIGSVNQMKKLLGRQGTNWNEFKKSVKQDMMVQKMIMKKESEAKVTSEDLREIRARHILIQSKKGKEAEAKDKIDRIYKRVKSGEDFSKLAKEFSEDPGSKDNGGDLGYFTTGMMMKPFEEVAFKLKLGEISPPVKTDFGYHIIKLEDTRLRKIEGQKDVEKAILQEKKQKSFSDWIYELKKNAKIEVLDPSLRALDLRVKGKLNEATFEYKKAIELSPNNAILHVFLGDLYEQLKKDDLAEEQYKKAVTLAAGDPSYYILLGNLYEKKKENKKAIEQYQKASKIAGDSKAIHQQLLDKFKALNSNKDIQTELSEISRINKKEEFEKKLKDKQNKIKVD